MTLNVLAVNDSRTMRTMLKMTREKAGFTSHHAEGGVDGLKVHRI